MGEKVGNFGKINNSQILEMYVCAPTNTHFSSLVIFMYFNRNYDLMCQSNAISIEISKISDHEANLRRCLHGSMTASDGIRNGPFNFWSIPPPPHGWCWIFFICVMEGLSKELRYHPLYFASVKCIDGRGFLENFAVSFTHLSDLSNLFFVPVWIF